MTTIGSGRRRSSAALASVATPDGDIIVRKAWAEKQHSYIIVLDGPTKALCVCLPDWRPRSPTSTRVQITPPQPATTVAAVTAAVAKLLPSWRAAAAGRSAPPVALVTLAASRDQAEVELRRSVRASSLIAYKKRWRRLDVDLSPTTTLVSIDRARLQAVVQALAGTLTPTGVRNHLTALHRALAPAIDAGVVPAAVFQRLVLPRAKPHQPRHLDRAQRAMVLAMAAARGQDVHLLFALGIYAGLRRAELLALRWKDIDATAGVLHVRSAADGSFVAKSGRDRTVPLCRPLAELLAAHRPVDDGFVLKPDYPPRRGLRWAFGTSFARVATEAKVPWLAPHDLRRTFATLAEQSDISVWKVRGWLGHTTVQVTERYTADTAAFDPEVERMN